MKRQDFYYELPQETDRPGSLEDRSSSRLLVLDKKSGAVSHHVFKEITDYLHEGDCLVINDTKVIPARLIGSKIGTGCKNRSIVAKTKRKRCMGDACKAWEKGKSGNSNQFRRRSFSR